MAQVPFRGNKVPVSPAHLLPFYVTSLFKLGNDPYGGSLGYPNRHGDITEPHLLVLGQADDHVAMITKKCPISRAGFNQLPRLTRGILGVPVLSSLSLHAY